MPAAAPNSFSVNRIFVLFNWQNFNSCKFFSVFLMKTGAAKFWICISIDFYSNPSNFGVFKVIFGGVSEQIRSLKTSCPSTLICFLLL